MQPGSSKFPSSSATLELVDKSLRSIQRHRKQRHAKLRDMAREDEDAVGLAGFRGGRGRWAGGSEGTLCPVCMKMVPGDPDVVEAHVDACLAHEARLQEERERQGRERQREEEIDIGSEYHILATDGASLRGASATLVMKCMLVSCVCIGLGFAVRDDTHHDVDDEIDVDGEDEAVFGVAQFTEGDVLGRPTANEDEDVDVEDDGPEPTQSPGASGSNSESGDLRQLVAEGKVAKKATAPGSLGDVKETMDQIMGVGEAEEAHRAVDLARKSGNSAALVEALDNKIRLLVSRYDSLYESITLTYTYRNRHEFLRRHLCSVEYASTRTPNRPCRLAAGTLVVGNVGCVVLALPGCVQYASALLRQRTYAECTCSQQ